MNLGQYDIKGLLEHEDAKINTPDLHLLAETHLLIERDVTLLRAPPACSASCGPGCGAPSETFTQAFQGIAPGADLNAELGKLTRALKSHPAEPRLRGALGAVVQRMLLDDQKRAAEAQSFKRQVSVTFADSLAKVQGMINTLPFVTKMVPITSGEYEDHAIDCIISSLNEANVALCALNDLRHLTPNLRMVYGLWVDKGSGLSAYDRPLDVTAYLACERVNGRTLAEWAIADFTPFEDKLSVLLQVLFTLAIAREACEFSHNDLHTNNVLVEELDVPIEITYRFSGRAFKLKTRVLAHIVDFARSHVSVRVPRELIARIKPHARAQSSAQCFDEERGVFHTGFVMPNFGIVPNGPNGLYDIARFVNTWLQVAERENNPANFSTHKLRTWLIAPLFGESVPDDTYLRNWHEGFNGVPLHIDLDPREYVLYLLRRAPGEIAALTDVTDGAISRPPSAERAETDAIPRELPPEVDVHPALLALAREPVANRCASVLPTREEMRNSPCARDVEEEALAHGDAPKVPEGVDSATMKKLVDQSLHALRVNMTRGAAYPFVASAPLHSALGRTLSAINALLE